MKKNILVYTKRTREREMAMAIKKERKKKTDTRNPAKNFTTFAQLKPFSYVFIVHVPEKSLAIRGAPSEQA